MSRVFRYFNRKNLKTDFVVVVVKVPGHLSALVMMNSEVLCISPRDIIWGGF